MTREQETKAFVRALAKASQLDFSPQTCHKCGATLWGDHCDICDMRPRAGGMDPNLNGVDPSYGRKYGKLD